MTLEECYAALEGSYTDAIGRLRSEKLVRKFAIKFLADPSFNCWRIPWPAKIIARHFGPLTPSKAFAKIWPLTSWAIPATS